MIEPARTLSPIQILAEGRDTQVVIECICKAIDLKAQCHDFGGKDEFRPRLRALVIGSGFIENVKTVAIVRDAEMSAAAAFQSAADACVAAGLPRPPKHGSLTSDATPRTGIYVLPDGTSAGMLETLLARVVAGDSVDGCIDSFLACAADRLGREPTPRDKAWLQSFVATRPHLARTLRDAAKAGLFDWRHDALAPLRAFLSELRRQ